MSFVKLSFGIPRSSENVILVSVVKTSNSGECHKVFCISVFYNKALTMLKLYIALKPIP